MIFYFSGTGNSQWAAGELGKILSEPLWSINQTVKEGKQSIIYPVKPDEKILFVFPIHSWGPPEIVTSFIHKLSFQNYSNQPVSVVCTCGDDCGYTDRMIADIIVSKGWKYQNCYSVTMPNNYILFPGFDVDSNEVEKTKLSQATSMIQEIGESIQQNKILRQYTQGSFAWIKSRVIQPWFVKHVLGKNSFYITETCISCGLCEKVCPTNTIIMESDKPVWKPTCVQCLACIHRCPVRAIEYGKVSLKKGRYHHPEVK